MDGTVVDKAAKPTMPGALVGSDQARSPMWAWRRKSWLRAESVSGRSEGKWSVSMSDVRREGLPIVCCSEAPPVYAVDVVRSI